MPIAPPGLPTLESAFGMTPVTDAPKAGWYKAPGDVSLVRYWNGEQWTALYRNQDQGQPAQSPPGESAEPAAEAGLIECSCSKCKQDWLVPTDDDEWRCGNCRSDWLLLRCRLCGGPQQVAPLRRREPCSWCMGRGFTGKVIRISARRFHEEMQELGTPLGSEGSDRRALLGCVVVGGFGHQLPNGMKLNAIFDRDEVRFTVVTQGSGSSSMRYRDITAFDIEGRGIIRTGAQIIGGGFGAVGAAEGMLAASLVNSLTARSRIETIINLRTENWGLYLFYDRMPPVNLKRDLSGAFAKVEAAQRGAHAELSKPDPVAQLAQLKNLHDSGALTADEFATAKAKLLAEM